MPKIPVKTEIKDLEDEKFYLSDEDDYRDKDESCVFKAKKKKRQKKCQIKDNLKETDYQDERKPTTSQDLALSSDIKSDYDPGQPLEIDPDLSYHEKLELRKKNYEMAEEYVKTT